MAIATRNFRTVKDRACFEIIEKLVLGKILPGQRISELQLSRELGVSRSPIREAMNQLSSRGWLDLVPGLGAYVRVPDKRELQELYEYREAMECMAVELAVDRVTPRQLRQLEQGAELMKRVIDRIDAEGLTDLDEEAALDWMNADLLLHQTILEASDNRKLVRALASLHVMVRGWSQKADFTRYPIVKILHLSYQEHREIVAALVSGRRRQARDAMRRHVRRVGRCFLRQYDSNKLKPLRYPPEVVSRLMKFEAELMQFTD